MRRSDTHTPEREDDRRLRPHLRDRYRTGKRTPRHPAGTQPPATPPAPADPGPRS